MKDKALYLPIILISLLLASGGCSVTDDPENIQPEIILQDARDITRNEATIGAEIIRHGSGQLTEFCFRYGRDKRMESRSENIDTDKSTAQLRLTGLKAGETYYYCAEGGNGSTVVRSEIKSFTTVPNDPPTVSEVKILSSGPVGVIVGFDVDDGGSSIISAGCIVTDNSSGEIWTIKSGDNPKGNNRVRVNIFVLSRKTSYTLIPFATNDIGETRGESIEFTTSDAILLKDGGELKSLIGSNNVWIDTLRIVGKMNSDDFRFLRLLLKAPLLPNQTEIKSSVCAVDLSNTEIISGGLPFDGMRFTENGIVSTGIFSNCSQLKWIKLPETATSLMRDAFSGSAIERIHISSGIAEIEPSDKCARLEEITVSAANRYFCDVDGVLMNIAKTEILWIPLADKGNFDIPQGIESLGMNLFRGSEFSSITLPSSIKTIGRGAFSETQLESIVIPDLVEQIADGLFQNSQRLTSITLGKSVNYIADYAFDGCPLASLTVKSDTPPVVTSSAFSSGSGTVFANCTLFVPKASIAIYRNHSSWGKFSSIKGF